MAASTRADTSSRRLRRVLLRCPSCGADVAFAAADRAARCSFCAAAHLVTGRGGVAALAVPSGIVSDEDARGALIADLGRRRLMELLGAGGSPSAEAEAAGWERALDTQVELLAARRFSAAAWHLAGRAWEAVIGRAADGARRVAVAVRAVELVRSATPAVLPVQDPGKLSYGPALRPLAARELAGVSCLVVAPAEERLAPRLERARAARLVSELEPIVRRSLVWADQLCLVLRPFLLLSARCRGRLLHVLLDAHSGSIAARLTEADVGAIAEATAVGPPAGVTLGGLALKPMRCGVCAGALPLDRQGEVRFCPTCRRAQRLEGESLTTVPHWVELAGRPPAGAVLLPFWRFAFTLTASDGRPLRSLTAVRTRLGGGGRRGESEEGWLDVPAFLPHDGPRPSSRPQRLGTLRRQAGARELAGPLGAEAGAGAPIPTAAISSREAAELARFALLLGLDGSALLRAPAPLLRSEVLDAPLDLSAPRLVLRTAPSAGAPGRC